MSASATQAWFKSHDWSEILQEKFPKKSGNLGNQNEYLELHNVLYMHIYIYVHIYIYIYFCPFKARNGILAPR